MSTLRPEQLDVSTGTSNNDTVTTLGKVDDLISAIPATAWGTITGTLSSQTDLQNALNAKQDTLTNGIDLLTSAEVTQLANIDTTTISTAQWAYLGAMNQGVAITNNVTFADLTLTDDFFFAPGTVFKNTAAGESKLTLVGNTGNAVYRAQHASSGASFVELSGQSADAQLNFGSNYNSFAINVGNVDVNTSIRGTTDNYLFYTDAGNDKVGIGTFSPATKLEVNGYITATGIIESVSSVQDIVAATGIATVSNTNIRVQSSTAGDSTVTANPAIVAGTVGQRLVVWGADDTKTVTFTDGNGLKLDNGQSITLGVDDNISFTYINSNWVETSRIIVS